MSDHMDPNLMEDVENQENEVQEEPVKELPADAPKEAEEKASAAPALIYDKESGAYRLANMKAMPKDESELEVKDAQPQKNSLMAAIQKGNASARKAAGHVAQARAVTERIQADKEAARVREELREEKLLQERRMREEEREAAEEEKKRRRQHKAEAEERRARLRESEARRNQRMMKGKTAESKEEAAKSGKAVKTEKAAKTTTIKLPKPSLGVLSQQTKRMKDPIPKDIDLSDLDNGFLGGVEAEWNRAMNKLFDNFEISGRDPFAENRPQNGPTARTAARREAERKEAGITETMPTDMADLFIEERILRDIKNVTDDAKKKIMGILSGSSANSREQTKEKAETAAGEIAETADGNAEGVTESAAAIATPTGEAESAAETVAAAGEAQAAGKPQSKLRTILLHPGKKYQDELMADADIAKYLDNEDEEDIEVDLDDLDADDFEYDYDYDDLYDEDDEEASEEAEDYDDSEEAEVSEEAEDYDDSEDSEEAEDYEEEEEAEDSEADASAYVWAAGEAESDEEEPEVASDDESDEDEESEEDESDEESEDDYEEDKPDEESEDDYEEDESDEDEDSEEEAETDYESEEDSDEELDDEDDSDEGDSDEGESDEDDSDEEDNSEEDESDEEKSEDSDDEDNSDDEEVSDSIPVRKPRPEALRAKKPDKSEQRAMTAEETELGKSLLLMQEKKQKQQKLALYCGGGILGALAIIYLLGMLFFIGHFAPNTTLNGRRVSGSSANGVRKYMERHISDYSMTLLEKEGMEETITGESLGLTMHWDQDKVRSLIAEQPAYAWPAYLFKKTEILLPDILSCEDSKLHSLMNGLSCMSASKQVMPVSANIVPAPSGEGFVITEEEYGTAINEVALVNIIEKAAAGLVEKVDLEKAGAYYEPRAYADDPRMKEALDQFNFILSSSIIYQAGSKSLELTSDTFAQWMELDGNLNIHFNDEMLTEFTSRISSRFTTAYREKDFTTTNGKTVHLDYSEYGWIVDRAAEKEQIVNDLFTGREIVREPIFSTRANGFDPDWGDTYVEINLTRQHLWLYEKGQMVVESPFVSGQENKGNGTPVGVYAIDYLQRDATLKGENYSTPVSFWMPFNGNVGMHDASWRKKFGGDLYEYAGSHGCINLPPDMAEQIYGIVHADYPVIVYKE